MAKTCNYVGSFLHHLAPFFEKNDFFVLMEKEEANDGKKSANEQKKCSLLFSLFHQLA